MFILFAPIIPLQGILNTKNILYNEKFIIALSIKLKLKKYPKYVSIEWNIAIKK